MNNLFVVMLPELVLLLAACALFLLGASSSVFVRRLTPFVALGALLAVIVQQTAALSGASTEMRDAWGAFVVGPFASYIKLLTASIGVLLVLLLWPTNARATGSASIEVGSETGEFFGLALLSLAGVLMVAGANDLILLFLAVEIASIPGYIMVSISRPLPQAQEAGVKYFFLGAMSAAVMLFGFSYLYGTTGLMKLDEIAALFAKNPGAFTPWQVLAVLMLLAGFAFKIAAVPLHAYAGDVYTGAATPVTAFLAFVPKTSGFVAILKVLATVGGGMWAAPESIVKTLWVVAALTMSFGNVLAFVQSSARANIKRVLAYSSIAHSGYMLTGVTALIAAPAGRVDIQKDALAGVLFYLAAYGIMNTAAFGVLMLLPTRERVYGRGARNPDGSPIATTAETFDDLAGVGRKHLGLGLAMAVSCFSLIGLPLTVGFLGKVFLIGPALKAGLVGLTIVTVINAAVSAAYYLRIVAVMFLPVPGEAADQQAAPIIVNRSFPVTAAIALSIAGTLLFGTFLPFVRSLSDRTQAANMTAPAPTPAVAAADR